VWGNSPIADRLEHQNTRASDWMFGARAIGREPRPKKAPDRQRSFLVAPGDAREPRGDESYPNRRFADGDGFAVFYELRVTNHSYDLCFVAPSDRRKLAG